MRESIKFEELHSGMRLWDLKENRWAKVLRVCLWEEIIKENPNRYYKEKIKTQRK